MYSYAPLVHPHVPITTERYFTLLYCRIENHLGLEKRRRVQLRRLERSHSAHSLTSIVPLGRAEPSPIRSLLRRPRGHLMLRAPPPPLPPPPPPAAAPPKSYTPSGGRADSPASRARVACAAHEPLASHASTAPAPHHSAAPAPRDEQRAPPEAARSQVIDAGSPDEIVRRLTHFAF